MRAVVITRAGGPEVLGLLERDEPEPGDHELLVDVRAAGLNRADLLQRRGLYPPPPGVSEDVPGLELSGEVVAVGSAVTRWAVGDRVMGLVGGGACAERVVLNEREALPVPHGMGWAEAAAVPEAFITAWDALFVQAGLKMGEVALVHAVGSGVGTAAVQLIRAAGAQSVGTSRTPDKVERARALGLGVGIVPEDGAFAGAAREATAGRGVDVVLDLVGGAYLTESLKAMAPRGRLILVGLLAGAQADLPLGLVLRQRLSITGTVLRSRPIEEKIATAQAFEAQVLPLLQAGLVAPVVHSTAPMSQVADAHRLLESGDLFGKVVLTW